MTEVFHLLQPLSALQQEPLRGRVLAAWRSEAIADSNHPHNSKTRSTWRTRCPMPTPARQCRG